MKRTVLVLCAVLASGIALVFAQTDVIVTIDDTAVNSADFDAQFNASSYAGDDSPQSRRDFLNNLINQKLVLQYALAQGWDKDPAFLSEAGTFSEAALIKFAVDRKEAEAAEAIVIPEEEVRRNFEQIQSAGSSGKSYEQERDSIEQELKKARAYETVHEWVKGLHRSSRINVNESLFRSRYGSSR